MNVLVIGATSGIGHALWRHYAAKGDSVVIVGRREDLLAAMRDEYPDNTIVEQCDIADVAAFDALLSRIRDRWSVLDLAIVCAGVGELNPDLIVDTELSTLAVNVTGWTNVVASVYKSMEEQGCGHLVALTSVGGMQPAPVAPSYSASKAFQINYIEALQRKSKGSGILVTEVRPGLVDTRMAKGDGLFWVMPVGKVAGHIIKAIERKRKRLITTRRWQIINYILKHI